MHRPEGAGTDGDSMQCCRASAAPGLPSPALRPGRPAGPRAALTSEPAASRSAPRSVTGSCRGSRATAACVGSRGDRRPPPAPGPREAAGKAAQASSSGRLTRHALRMRRGRATTPAGQEESAQASIPALAPSSRDKTVKTQAPSKTKRTTQ